MKRLFLFLALVAVTLSCVRREDEHNCETEDLNNRVTALENSRIPTIEQQIESINLSISDLEQLSEALKQQIAELEKSADATAEEIATLNAKSQELYNLIQNLYAHVEYLSSSTIDWVSATFATLEQYNALASQVSNLKALLEQYKSEANTNLRNAIAALDLSMKKWVNEQLANYYTIAEVDEKIEALEKAIDSTTNAGLAEEINKMKEELQAMKEELTEAYEKAIEEAINANNGLIDNKIATAVVTINQQIDNKILVINTRISTLEQRLGLVEGKVATIEEQIENIKQTIASLQAVSQQLREAIAALEQNGGSSVDLSALRAKDAELEEMIEKLQQYVNKELADMEDWANATFATLEQQAALAQELEAIRTIINNYNLDITATLNAAISKSESLMKAWVNTQLEGYYTIAEIDDRIQALQQQIENSTNSALAEQVNELKDALAAMKSELTAAYKKAISDAIESNNGVIDSKIATEIANVNDRIDDEVATLKNRISVLEQRLGIVEGKIETIEGQIENISKSIEDLKDADAELKDYIDNLEAIVAALQKSLNDTNSKITAIEKELQSGNGQVNAEILAQLNALRAEMEAELAQILQTIATLQEKDREIELAISDLQNYINNELANMTDWANATFATLRQFSQLADEVAAVKQQINAINLSITDLENRINQKIANEIAKAVALLESDIQQKVSEVTAAYTSAISDAKNEITAAYTAAISNAISNLESSIKVWVNAQLSDYYTISEVEALLAAMEAEFNSKLNAQRAYLEGLINSLSDEINNGIITNDALIQQLQNSIKELQDTSSEQAEAIAKNATAISKNAQNIVNNTAAIVANGVQIDNLESQIAQLKAQMESKIDELEDAIANNNTNVTNQQIEALRSDYESKINALRAEMQNLINTNKALIDANAASIANNSSAIAANDAAIKALQTSTNNAITQNAAAIAQNAVEIANNAALIAQNAAAINNNAQAIAQNSADILALQQDLAKAKSDITAAYKKAIEEAINTLDGELRDAIAEEVAKINTRIDNEVSSINSAITALTSRVETLENEVEDIKSQIDDILKEIADLKNDFSKLLNHIQSVAYIPKYSDGKATVIKNIGIDDGIVEFDFQVSPMDATAEIAASWQSILTMKAVHTLTRAVTFIELPILTFEADTNSGVISMSVSGKNLGDEFFAGKQPASAALYLSDGNNSITSDYIEMVPLKRFKMEYTATAMLNPFNEAAFGANIIENNFDEKTGKGYLIFDSEVSTIGEKALFNCDELKSITLPNIITTIGESAFNGCDALTKVVIPDSVTLIDASAFYDCGKLAEVTIGENIRSIREHAFDNCPSLAKIYVERVTPSLADWTMFLTNAAGRKIYVPAESIMDYRTAEGWKYYASSIVGYDFITGEVVVEGPTTSEIYYTSTNGQAITLAASADFGTSTLVSNTYNDGVGVLLFDAPITTIGEYAFNNCTTLATITLPSSLTTIGSYAFAMCSGLKDITIPGSVDSLGNCAFRGCTKLSAFYGKYANSDNKCLVVDGVLKAFAAGCGLGSYTIPADVTEIGMSAFYSSKSLAEVTIPEWVTTIGDDVFYGCINLKSVYCKRTTPPTAGGTYMFDNNHADRKIYVPMASVAAYKSATNWSKYEAYIVGFEFNEEGELTGEPANNEIWYTTTDGNILTPNDINVFGANLVSNTYENGKGVIKFDGEVSKIGSNAFESCSRLKEIIIPNSVTSIGSEAFTSCNKLTKIDIPNKVTLIGSMAFEHCYALTNVTLGNSIKSIGNYAFESCSKLTNITIPNSVTSIGNHAFRYCSGLTTITIPNSVTSIGDYAFHNCSGLTTITIAESVTSIGASAFKECSKLTSVYCKAITPPAGSGNMFNSNAANRIIYVPSEVVGAYKVAPHWVDYASAIEGYDF